MLQCVKVGEPLKDYIRVLILYSKKRSSKLRTYIVNIVCYIFISLSVEHNHQERKLRGKLRGFQV